MTTRVDREMDEVRDSAPPVEVLVHLDMKFQVHEGEASMSLVMSQLGIMFSRYRSSTEEGNGPLEVSVWGAHIELPSENPNRGAL